MGVCNYMRDYIGNSCLDIISLFLHFKVKIIVSPIQLYIHTLVHLYTRVGVKYS